MKKLLIALFAISIAASAMARYWVYDVRMSGSGIEVQEGKGKIIENGETTITNKLTRSTGSLSGHIIEDEYLEWYSFLLPEKGGYMQSEAEMDVEISEFYLVKYDSNDSGEKFSGKGTAVANVSIDLDDVILWSTVIGMYSESWTWSWSEGEEAWKFSYSGIGAGQGEEYVDPSIGWTDSIYVNNVKVKYNSKLSNAMSDAYYDTLDSTEGDEAAAVQAAEDVLNAYINKKAKIDDASFDLPVSI